VFCRQFYKDTDKTGFGSIAIVILFIFLCMASCKALAWYLLKLLFTNEPKLRVMGLFGCTQKTIALGIPLILAIFGDSDNLGMYSLPILIWHPMQLVFGAMLVPKLQKFITSETQRLGLTDDSRYLTTTTADHPVATAADDRV
jgi:sodium/bile acid cotransporter 7